MSVYTRAIQPLSPLVSERALFERCRRKLRREYDCLLRRCPESSRGFYEVGRFYVVAANNAIVDKGWLSIEGLARELGVLRPGEQLAE